MKKSLIALAVLAASGASFAQSNVTLYGLADIWVGSVKTETAGVSTTQTLMESGGVNSSRWGMKGSEDLGGGLKANFKLEQGFKLDTGAASAGQAFSRESYVGFSGGFGEVKLGKVWTAYDDVSGASDAMFDSGALAPMNIVFRSVGYSGNPGNTIYYASPSMGGFAAAVSYSLDENVLGAAAVSSLNLTYGAGPIAVQFGYQVEDLDATSDDTKFMRVGGSYDFGMAVAKLTYGKVTDVGNVNGADTSEYQLGVDVPVGPALTVSASYAKSDDNAAAGDQSRKGYGIAAAYTLSKRTFLYTGYTNNKFSQVSASDDTVSAFAVGVQHKF
ncbi:porin [Rhodoferax sp.]|uniref:porin n=1 Tax=Rhodoferax sp. TaxID=50421 RepID=UPI00260252A2|nr:porin [Rhodoferax sp.]MDD2918925.1 porin [Rhodoferax sp.]